MYVDVFVDSKEMARHVCQVQLIVFQCNDVFKNIVLFINRHETDDYSQGIPILQINVYAFFSKAQLANSLLIVTTKPKLLRSSQNGETRLLEQINSRSYGLLDHFLLTCISMFINAADIL